MVSTPVSKTGASEAIVWVRFPPPLPYTKPPFGRLFLEKIMNNKINQYVKKIKWRARKKLKREEARCRASYPDWEKNENNLLDYKFLWGYTPNSTRSLKPSFYTWEDFYIYYNRADKRYYFHVDTGIYRYINQEAAREEIGRLVKIKVAFGDFLSENGFSTDTEICFDELQQDGAESLSALYRKFCILVDGFIAAI